MSWFGKTSWLLRANSSFLLEVRFTISVIPRTRLAEQAPVILVTKCPYLGVSEGADCLCLVSETLVIGVEGGGGEEGQGLGGLDTCGLIWQLFWIYLGRKNCYIVTLVIGNHRGHF